MPEPFGDADCPAAVTGRLGWAGLALLDPAPSCGFFRGAWPAGGFGPLLPGAEGLPAAVAAEEAGFAVVDGLAGFAGGGFGGATALGVVSLLRSDGLAGDSDAAGPVPAAATAVPGTCGGYLLNSTYCWPSVHTFVVTQYRTSPKAQYRPERAKNGTM